MRYPSQQHVDVDNSTVAATTTMPNVHSTSQVHSASVAASQMQDGTAETACSSNSCVMDDDEGAHDNGDEGEIVFRRSSSSSSSGTSAELHAASRRLISGKDAGHRRPAGDWLPRASSAWKDDLAHSSDSEISVDDLRQTPDDNPEAENSAHVGDDTDCACWNDADCTTAEVEPSPAVCSRNCRVESRRRR